MPNFLKRYKFQTFLIIGGLAFFAYGFFLGFSFLKSEPEKKVEILEKDEFNFVNSDIVFGKKNIISKADYLSLRNDLVAFIENKKEKGAVSEVSVYFRDLRNGPTLGIDEQSDFAPASLLKLPMSFAVFGIEEENPGFIRTNLIFREDIGAQYIQRFPSMVSPKKNEPYSLETLIHYMLTYSDNVSYSIITDYLNSLPNGSNEILKTFQEIGIIDPQSHEEETLTVRGYAALFRLLYNASYLSIENSQKILSWLSQSDFKEGLSTGVPEGMVVAHKFGEREIENSQNSQIHDCGIVYYPENPYLLCIMTRGNNIDNMTEIIGEISKMFYTEVDSRRIRE